MRKCWSCVFEIVKLSETDCTYLLFHFRTTYDVIPLTLAVRLDLTSQNP